jgi:hypothetical protein
MEYTIYVCDRCRDESHRHDFLFAIKHWAEPWDDPLTMKKCDREKTIHLCQQCFCNAIKYMYMKSEMDNRRADAQGDDDDRD